MCFFNHADCRCSECHRAAFTFDGELAGEPCAMCGHVRTPLPEWAKQRNTEFALDGKLYRTVSYGSSNGGTADHLHFWDYVIVEPVRPLRAWALPDAPATREDVGDALAELFKMQRFKAAELARAIRVLV